MAQHAIVFVDHIHASVLRLDGSNPDTFTSHSKHHIGENLHGAAALYAEVADAIREDKEILIVGPGTAKSELVTYLAAHSADVCSRVVGVETVDHPTDNQLKALARARFKAIDRMI